MQENEEIKKAVKKSNNTKNNSSKAVSSKKEKVEKTKESISKKNTNSRANTTKAKKSTSKNTNKTNRKIATDVKKKETVKNTKTNNNKTDKIVRESKKTITSESKENSKKLEDKKIVVKVSAKNKDSKEKIDQVVVIEKIKDFISKVVAMQEEVKKESEDGKSKTKINAKKESKTKTEKKEYIVEYYDLPYRYNETIVKILAQTPKKLFVYWDISDNDRNKYIETFGENFFDTTYPVLLLYNEDKKYVKEVVINDFANSWYIDIDDPKTKYTVQLGRKFKNPIEFLNVDKLNENNIILRTDYLPFADSNSLEVPNDHVLLDQLPEFIVFRNVKTNAEFRKDIRSLKDIFGNNYDVKEFYENQYKEEIDDGMFSMDNPSSNMTSSVFK